jgi:hypothetical protein
MFAWCLTVPAVAFGAANRPSIAVLMTRVINFFLGTHGKSGLCISSEVIP